MKIPDIIEIIPPSKIPAAEITVPGSKSITNRALILGALSTGTVTLHGALASEDTEVMSRCLEQLGFSISVSHDKDEMCNRTITITGAGGIIPQRGGTEVDPLTLYIGNAGTAARFLTALVCLGDGAYRIEGTPRMHERPQAELFTALRSLGYKIDSHTNRLPALVHGAGRRPGDCRVDISKSSQFASALLLCAHRAEWRVHVEGENENESSYITMTKRMSERFPHNGGSFQIEPDASSASYFRAADALANQIPAPAGLIRIKKAPDPALQIDAKFPEFLPLPETISRKRDLGDSIMTAIVLAAFSKSPVRFIDLGRLRLQECERVKALCTELSRCGITATEEGDSIIVHPSQPKGAIIETYNDHRMAMCFAVLGLRIQGIRISNPNCVKKTFPDFFQKLAAAPQKGLGATIKDSESGYILPPDDLVAA
ncbi:MAG: 3-phosphoshikimate 1-carboxyvinyltransferase [Verrucomicrobia bacterium]|nr:3-phosphoshikimate 1-carboxyvinyltransferase [Verrucomicrobiota bacterium]